MYAIFKYPMPMPERGIEIEVEMPVDAEILSVQAQRDVPTIWARVEVDPVNKKAAREMRTRKFLFLMTGQPHEFYKPVRYIATVQLNGGGFVVHFFEQHKE